MTTPSSPPPLALTRVSTVCFVLRHVRVNSIKDIIKLAHVNDAFRDALESWSPTLWRRLASRLDGSMLLPFFKRNVFVWAAENLLTVGQLDVSVMFEHPLLVAAQCGAADVVRVCVAADPDCVDVCDCYERTALHSASLPGHIECARALLDAGADITIADITGHTALRRAAEQGHADVVHLLIAHPDFVKIRDMRNKRGTTALHAASLRGHTDCVGELLGAGADITVADNTSWTALHCAAKEGHADVVRLLVAHADFEEIRDERNIDGKTAAELAKTNEITRLLSTKSKNKKH